MEDTALTCGLLVCGWLPIYLLSCGHLVSQRCLRSCWKKLHTWGRSMHPVKCIYREQPVCLKVSPEMEVFLNRWAGPVPACS